MQVAITTDCAALRAPSQRLRARKARTPGLPPCRSLLPLYDVPPIDPAVSEQATYATLAALGASFGLTFGVAPRFKTLFRETDTWREIYGELLNMGGVDSISPADALGAVKKGAIIVDVRLSQRFEAGAIDGSDNFPLYQPISGWSLPANIRRAGFAFFGVYGTERNTTWLTDIESWIPKDQEVIVACEMGGSMECKPGADTGFQSQSLKALYFLKKAGYQKVRHMKGGVAEYMRTVGPLVPPGDMEDQALAPGRARA